MTCSFDLICVSQVMTELATDGQDMPVAHHTHVGLDSTRTFMWLFMSVRSLFPATAESSGSLTSKFDFSEHPGPGMVPMDGSWMSSSTAPQACRSCLQGVLPRPWALPLVWALPTSSTLSITEILFFVNVFTPGQMQATVSGEQPLLCSNSHRAVAAPPSRQTAHFLQQKEKTREYLPPEGQRGAGRACGAITTSVHSLLSRGITLCSREVI